MVKKTERNGVDFPFNVWGDSKGQYIVKDEEGNILVKTQFSTTNPGQIDRYTFNDKLEHDHHGIDENGEPFKARNGKFKK